MTELIEAVPHFITVEADKTTIKTNMIVYTEDDTTDLKLTRILSLIHY